MEIVISPSTKSTKYDATIMALNRLGLVIQITAILRNIKVHRERGII